MLRRLALAPLLFLLLACSSGGSIDSDGGEAVTRQPASVEPRQVIALPNPARMTATLKEVRTGDQSGWDRIVFEFASDAPAADIAYVPSVSQCGSGAPVTVGGGAVLLVSLHGANAHDAQGRPTFGKNTVSGPGKAIVEAKQICDFEAEVGWAIGVKGQRPFKVTPLTSPRRIVIDVQQ